MKSWAKRIRWTFLLVFCLVAGGYAGMRVWRWASVPRNAPVVGLSLDTAWHARAGITTSSYQVALTRAGAQILEVRPENGRPEQILDQIDALLLAGGGDVDPALFDGEPSEAQLVDRDRDEFELALIRGALDRDIPILGICRGIQILNVFQGGSLRNLRSESELAATHGIDLDSMDAHSVEIAAGSKLGQLLGAGPRRVNSFHGQAVGEVGEGLQVAARASDGVVEAIEMPDRRFVVGMQWHPEAPPQQMAVFEAFFEAAKAYRQRRGQ